MKRYWKLAVVAFSISVLGVNAQAPVTGGKEAPGIPTSAVKEARPTGSAAKVNNQDVPELAVYRALRAVPKEDHVKARPDILNFLIDNVLVDQYLVALKIQVEPKDIEKQHEDFKAEVKKHGQEYAKVLENLMLSEEELKEQIVNQLRWEKFVNSQATTETLQKIFEANKEVFDGTMVRARHILVTPAGGDEKAKHEAAAKTAQIKAACEKAVNDAMGKLPATTDAAQKEQYRVKFTEDAFVQLAKAHSNCPSAKDGGDLNWFPRAGSMVEPFAKAAFASKTFVIGDVVQTQHGYHLILVTAKKPGTPTEFEKVKDAAKEFYEGKLREAVTTKMRGQSKIEIADSK